MDDTGAPYIDGYQLLDSSDTAYAHSYLTACNSSKIPAPDSLRSDSEFLALFDKVTDPSQILKPSVYTLSPISTSLPDPPLPSNSPTNTFDP